MNDAAHTFDYYAGLAVEMHGQTLNVPGESMSMVVREPVGVTVGITPWNFPILMAAWKAAPALAAGNVMIIKPASVSPLTTLELARIFEEVGLPAGVLGSPAPAARRRPPRDGGRRRHGNLTAASGWASTS
jgi:betaine-aldehyde dehydrogenase